MPSRLQGIVALGTAAKEAATQVAAASVAIRSSTSAIRGDLGQLSAETSTVTKKILAETDSLKEQVATALDDIASQLIDGGGFQDEIAQQIEAVKIGLVDFQDFVTVWGGSVSQTGETIRELLRDIDPDQFKERIFDLIRNLEAGTVSVNAAIDFLGQSQSIFAERFTEIVTLYQQGKLTLEGVARQVKTLTELYPDNAASDLVDEIVLKLQQGGNR